MNVAILHFHLNRGGVAQVILGHLRSLNTLRQGRPDHAAVLYGGRASDWPEGLTEELSSLRTSFHVVDGLDYDDGDARPECEPLADSLRKTLQRLNFRSNETVLHVHNHNLGKNASLPGALEILAAEGYGILYQIHDFAEDFRPENYRHMVASLCPSDPTELPRHIYPNAEQIHYAVLNGRDRQVLATAGVPDRRLHLLPNPVTGAARHADRDVVRAKYQELFGVASDSPLALYPVRGIRRKNLGEALLWSALGGGDFHVGLTLAPMNPVERPSYRAWRRLSRQLKLSCLFELGEHKELTFDENLAAADYLLTTSIAEGFGLVFLETWLNGRPLIGRDLPEITADFTAGGIQFPLLSDRLDIPVDWIGESVIRETLSTLYREVVTSYGLTPMSDEAVQAEIDPLLDGGMVDFAVLDRAAQEKVIRRVCREAPARDTIIQRNPRVRDILSSQTRPDHATIEANAGRVRDDYSLEVSAERLTGIYRAVVDSDRSDRIAGIPHGERILQQFISPSRLHPIRLES